MTPDELMKAIAMTESQYAEARCRVDVLRGQLHDLRRQLARHAAADVDDQPVDVPVVIGPE
jgi:hypothetical protein